MKVAAKHSNPVDGSGTSVNRNSLVSVLLPEKANVYSLFARPSSVVSDPPKPISPVAASNAAMADEFSVISAIVPISAAVIVRLP